MAETDEAPDVGAGLSVSDVEMIYEAVEQRQHNFPEEPRQLSLALVLFNIGDRFAPVTCVGGEWSHLKRHVPRGNPDDIPKCPNGHVLTQGPGLRLGWIAGQ